MQSEGRRGKGRPTTQAPCVYINALPSCVPFVSNVPRPDARPPRGICLSSLVCFGPRLRAIALPERILWKFLSFFFLRTGRLVEAMYVWLPPAVSLTHLASHKNLSRGMDAHAYLPLHHLIHRNININQINQNCDVTRNRARNRG